MDINYQYFIAYVLKQASKQPSLRVLDYGCGTGLLVHTLRHHGVECFGAEVFYEAADFQEPHLTELMSGGLVRKIPPDGRLPFADGSFDLIFSNQVFEHVEKLDLVVDELSRLLSPRGKMYHHFPSREVVREGHFGIPLSHRIDDFSVRRKYLLMLRALGLGHHKADHDTMGAWADHATRYLEDYCFYRPYAEICRAFDSRYHIVHREIAYMRFRAEATGKRAVSGALRIPALVPAWEALFRRLAFMAIELSPR